MEILIIMKEKAKKLFARFLTILGINNLKSMYYIGGSDTLPPPLTSEEENDILEKLMNNDESVKKGFSRKKPKTSCIHSQKI